MRWRCSRYPLLRNKKTRNPTCSSGAMPLLPQLRLATSEIPRANKLLVPQLQHHSQAHFALLHTPDFEIILYCIALHFLACVFFVASVSGSRRPYLLRPSDSTSAKLLESSNRNRLERLLSCRPCTVFARALLGSRNRHQPENQAPAFLVRCSC